MSHKEKRGWIGVDLDGTLAEYDHWRGPEHIGTPIQPMIARVQQWIQNGQDVRIFTARVARPYRAQSLPHIQTWCLQHIGHLLPVTNIKDHGMIALWDDRAIQVEPNTGRRMDNQAD